MPDSKKRKRTSPSVSKRQRESLRKFRTSIATLKKAGVVSPSIDARKIQPTKHYRSIVRQYKGVAEGRERTVKLSRKFLAIAKEDGKKVVRDRVIIDNNPGMHVIYDSKDPYGYRISHPAKGYEMIEHRGPGTRSLKKYAEYAESQMSPGGYIGFTVDGNRSNMLYTSVSEAVAAFERYKSMRTGSKREQRDLASSFTIYRIPKGQKWHWKPGKAKPSRKRRKK